MPDWRERRRLFMALPRPFRAGGSLATARDGDISLIDGDRGVFGAKISASEWVQRQPD